MSVGKTASAKMAAKRDHLEQMTLEDKLMLPLYLHYRSIELTKNLKVSIEHRPHNPNT